MPATYEPIASQTLGSDAASVTFSDIPGTYTDLRLIVMGRSSWTTDGYEVLNIRFNSDTGSNYSATRLNGSGSAASSDRVSSSSVVGVARFNHSQSGNTTPSIALIDVMSYSNGNVYKTILGASAASVEAYPVSRGVGLWRSTSAITSITMLPAQGTNLKSGLTASLFGIKAA